MEYPEQDSDKGATSEAVRFPGSSPIKLRASYSVLWRTWRGLPDRQKRLGSVRIRLLQFRKAACCWKCSNRWRRAEGTWAQLPAISPIEYWLSFRRTRRSDSPTLAWSSLQHLLENAIPHVLIILDCCFAANAARDTAEGSTKEILAACGRENPTAGVGLRSFTSALIEELHAFGSNPFTVAMLHSRLVTMRWRLQFTPIYALLSEHGGNSIQLAPLPTPKVSEPHASLQGNGECALGDDPMDLSSNDESLFSASAQQSSQSSMSARSETRVLLAVSIQQDAVRDVSQWVTWLTTQAPWDVTKVEVKVEGAYESHSMLVLVSIPTYAWDGLPDKEAYRFIDFIKSSNLQQPGSSLHTASRAPSVANLSKEHKSSPLVSVSQHGPTKSLKSSAEAPKVALQKSHQTVKRHGKDGTAVVKLDTGWDVESDDATMVSLTDVYSNVHGGKKSYDTLQTNPTPSGDLNIYQALSSSSIRNITSTDGKSVQSKPRSTNEWIRPSRSVVAGQEQQSTSYPCYAPMAPHPGHAPRPLHPGHAPGSLYSGLYHLM
jgi:hypothetical protein